MLYIFCSFSRRLLLRLPLHQSFDVVVDVVVGSSRRKPIPLLIGCKVMQNSQQRHLSLLIHSELINDNSTSIYLYVFTSMD